MFRAILCSSSGGQNCIFTTSVIVTLCKRPYGALHGRWLVIKQVYTLMHGQKNIKLAILYFWLFKTQRMWISLFCFVLSCSLFRKAAIILANQRYGKIIEDTASSLSQKYLVSFLLIDLPELFLPFFSSSWRWRQIWTRKPFGILSWCDGFFPKLYSSL
jgi:hypothetical protein